MREEFAMLLFVFGISFTANVALAIAAFRAARRAQRLETRLRSQAGVDDERVDRLEQLVDAMDQKISQLSRGQEFLSKLVSERRRTLNAPEPHATPH
jgi:hypothetical protein